MHRESTILDRSDRVEKFPLGPTRSKPGPMLLTQVSAALKEVAKEWLSSETTSVPIRIILI